MSTIHSESLEFTFPNILCVDINISTYPTEGRVYSSGGSGELSSQTDGTVCRTRRAIVCVASVVHAQSSLTFSTTEGCKRAIIYLYQWQLGIQHEAARAQRIAVTK